MEKIINFDKGHKIDDNHENVVKVIDQIDQIDKIDRNGQKNRQFSC